METDKKLSKDAKPGELAIRGTVKPDITGDAPPRHDPYITADHCEHRNLRVCDSPELHAGARP